MLIPDLVIVSAGSEDDSALLEPSEVLVAVEIVSPGSTTRDRSEKPYMYAEAGIPHFWRIELASFRGRREPLPVLLVHELDADGQYQVMQRAGRGSTARVERPFLVELDPAVLVEGPPPLVQ